MKTISIIIPKGGSGKTTTTVCLAFVLAEAGSRVLVIDCDPQGDTTKTLLHSNVTAAGLPELLEDGAAAGGEYTARELCLPTEYKGITVLPGSGDLFGTNHFLTSKGPEAAHRLEAELLPIAPEYDYCLCDCGRLLDMVVINALTMSDRLLVPVKCGGYETEAIKSLAEQLDAIADQLKPGTAMELLFTMRQKNKAAQAMEERLAAMTEGAEGLARNIELCGLLQNLEVMYAPCEKGKYQLIAGEKRFRALQLLTQEGKAGFAVASCKKTRPQNIAEETIEMILSNGYRVKTLRERLEEAQALEAAIQEIRKTDGTIFGRKIKNGRTRDLIAQMLQYATGTIGQLDKINKSLLPEFLAEVYKGRLNQATAYALARCSAQDQETLYQRYQAGEELTAGDADRLREKAKPAAGEPEEAEKETQGPEMPAEAAGAQETEEESRAAGGQEPEEGGAAAGIEVPEEIDGPERMPGKMCQTMTPAERTEEQKYSREQAAIDRETKKRLREQEDKAAMDDLPSTREPELLEDRIPAGDYADITSGRLPILIRKQDKRYKVGTRINLAEYHQGEHTGRSIQIEVVNLLEDCAGIAEGYCILVFELMEYDI